jgi:hypothetical protein
MNDINTFQHGLTSKIGWHHLARGTPPERTQASKMETRERLARAINPVAWIVETHDKARAESLLAADRILLIFPDLDVAEFKRRWQEDGNT